MEYMIFDPELWPVFYVGRISAVILPGHPNGSFWVGPFTLSDGQRAEPIDIRRISVTLFEELTDEEVRAAGLDALTLERAITKHISPELREAWEVGRRPVTVARFVRRLDS